MTVYVSLRLLDGEAGVWYAPGGAPEEEQPGDRSAARGLRHDAAGNWHEGGGTGGVTERGTLVNWDKVEG